MNNADVINRLCALNRTESYLEVGVSRGVTYKNVVAKVKTGVDPRPKIDPRDCVDLNVVLKTSNDFFENNSLKFDFIFLDGLHTSDQTAKDFANSVRFSKKGTLWLIDDVFPDSNASSARSLFQYRLARYTEMIYHQSFKPIGWQGDVFRVIENLPALEKWFKYWTICGPGNRVQTVIAWKNQNLAEEVMRMFDVDLNKDLDQFLRQIDESIEANVPKLFKTQRYFGRKAKHTGQPSNPSDLPSWYHARPIEQIESEIRKLQLA